MFDRVLRHRFCCFVSSSFPRLTIIPRLFLNTQSRIEQCWKCKKSIDRNECLTYCPCEQHVLLSIRTDVDYFRLFDLSRSFEIDNKQLTKYFRMKMKSLHPDLFTNKSDIEKKNSQDQSALLNEAYKTLFSPLSRAHCLLKLENITLEDRTVELPPEFLMNIMDINEKLNEHDHKKDEFPIELTMEIRQQIDDHMKELSQALNTMDLSKARIILARLQYFNNINDKLIELEVKHGMI